MNSPSCPDCCSTNLVDSFEGKIAAERGEPGIEFKCKDCGLCFEVEIIVNETKPRKQAHEDDRREEVSLSFKGVGIPVWITVVRLLLEERFVKTEYIAAVLIDYFGSVDVRYAVGLPPGTTSFPPIDNEMVLVTWLVHEWLSEYNEGEFIQLETGAWGKSTSDDHTRAEAMVEANDEATKTPYFRMKLSNGELIIIDGEIFSTTDWVERYIHPGVKSNEAHTKIEEYRKIQSSLSRRDRDLLQYIAEKGSFSTSDWALLNKRWKENNLGKVSQARISQMTTKLIKNKNLYCLSPPKTKLEGKNRFRFVMVSEEYHFMKTQRNIIAHGNANSRWDGNEFATVLRMREEGKTIAEIAMMLGRTESSVWAKLKRERKS